MRRLFAILALIVTILTFLPSANAQQQATATPVDPAQPLGDFMGMVVRDPHYEWNTNPAYPNDVNRAFLDTMGANLQAAGVKWVRIEFQAEPTAQEGSDIPGQIRFAAYDYFINTVAPANNLKVLALLATPLVRQRAGTDAVSCPNDSNDPSRAYPAGQYFDPELLEYSLCLNTGASQYGYVNPYMKIWLDNAFQIAKAFPYNKATGAGIAAYEVLNEENRYLNGGGKGLKPDAVATLVTKFYRVFKINGGPDGSLGAWGNDVKIILGGLQPDRCTDCGAPAPGMTDREYLNAIYRSSAFQNYYCSSSSCNRKYPIDGVGYHPYPMEMRSGLVPEDTAINDLFRVPQRMQAIRNVMLQNGDAANKLWITEVGDRGAPITVDPAGDNERRQAQFMRSIYFMLWQDRDFVENVFWFKYEDFEVPASGVGPSNWGVVRLMPRPADQMQCGTCEYDQNGTVQQYKQSYWTYQDIAQNGFDTYKTFLPIATR